MKPNHLVLYNKYKQIKTKNIMQTPQGRTRVTEAEKAIIREYRAKGYSLAQIAQFVQRSPTAVKRVVYNW